MGAQPDSNPCLSSFVLPLGTSLFPATLTRWTSGEVSARSWDQSEPKEHAQRSQGARNITGHPES